MRRPLGILFALHLALACCAPVAPVQAADRTVRAEEVKAAFLKRFIQFVAWPDAAEPSGTVVVGVVGGGPLGDAVAALDGSRAGDLELAVVSVAVAEAIPAGVHVLVVCPEIDGVPRLQHPRWKNLGWLAERPLLTVGDDPDFMDAGGIIGFYLEGERIRFAARREAAVQISSKLLRLAKVVD